MAVGAQRLAYPQNNGCNYKLPCSKVIYFVWFHAPKAGADCSFGLSHVVGPSLVKWGSGGQVVLSEHLTPHGFASMGLAEVDP